MTGAGLHVYDDESNWITLTHVTHTLKPEHDRKSVAKPQARYRTCECVGKSYRIWIEDIHLLDMRLDAGQAYTLALAFLYSSI